jgi:type II secretory pathway pseudopilin PulG
MPILTASSICRSRSKRRVGQDTDSGFGLLFALIAATVLLVGLTVVLPGVYQEGQREREQELVFRGRQYARAIAGFHRRFGRYPTTVEELIKPTNGWRFLRQEYADPMTPDGDWRFIHANAMGVPIDSKIQQSLSGVPGFPGAPQMPGGLRVSSAFSLSGGFGSVVGDPESSVNPSGQQPTRGGGPGAAAAAESPGISAQQIASPIGGAQGEGGFILGVASTSHQESIRVWNKQTYYDEWEFLGIDQAVFGISIPWLQQGVPGLPGMNGQPINSGPAPGVPLPAPPGSTHP